MGSVCLLLAIILVYLILEFGFVHQFKQLITSIRKGANSLDQGVIEEPPSLSHSSIHEIRHLSGAVEKYISGLKAFHKRTQLKSKTEAMGEIAAQVRHDLASPLTALEFTLNAENLSGIPETSRTLIRNTLTRIREIIRQLSTKGKGSDNTPLAPYKFSEEIEPEENPATEMVSTLVNSIVEEKNTQYRNRSKIQIVGLAGAESYGQFIKVQPNEFKRVISNLIDNSVQAIKEKGTVHLKVSTNSKKVHLFVHDNGCGIPKKILSTMFERGVSNGKINGSGLGLWHAKRSVKRWGGEISVDSTPGNGTTIEITLPLAESPQWFVPYLKLAPSTELVVLDDDPNIHQIWKKRFDELKNNHGIKQHHFEP